MAELIKKTFDLQVELDTTYSRIRKKVVAPDSWGISPTAAWQVFSSRLVAMEHEEREELMYGLSPEHWSCHPTDRTRK
jgi:hypothetical protein